MASYRKRGKTWRAEVVVGAIRESASFPDRARAVAWGSKVEGELRAAARGEIIPRSVRQGLERYRDEVTPGHRGGHWERVRIGKFLGTPDKRWPEAPRRPSVPFVHKLMQDVTRADVAAWRDGMLKTLATSSARREYGLLRSVFALAASEWLWVRVSPFDTVEPPAEGKARSQRVSDDQIAKILAALGYEPGTAPETAQHFIALAMQLAVETAMRKGEILTLDQESRRGRVLHLERTKNGDERDVPLSTRAVAVLELLPAGRFAVSSGTFDTLFRRARDKAAPGVHFHDLRREATTRLAAKLDVLTLAKMTGHRDVKLLLRTYYAPDMDGVADRLG